MLMLAGCAGIEEMQARPAVICPSESVEVSWQARGAAQLFQIPLKQTDPDQCSDALIAGRSGRSVPSVGQVQQPVSQNTVFYLAVRGSFGKTAHQCARVFVNAALPLSAVPQCVGPRTARAAASRPPDSRWSGTTKVGAVQSLNDVPIIVRHDGREERLAPRATSSAFANSDSDGVWSFDYLMSDGPDCGHAGAIVPPSLSLSVLPYCSNPTKGLAQ